MRCTRTVRSIERWNTSLDCYTMRCKPSLIQIPLLKTLCTDHSSRLAVLPKCCSICVSLSDLPHAPLVDRSNEPASRPQDIEARQNKPNPAQMEATSASQRVPQRHAMFERFRVIRSWTGRRRPGFSQPPGGPGPIISYLPRYVDYLRASRRTEEGFRLAQQTYRRASRSIFLVAS